MKRSILAILLAGLLLLGASGCGKDGGADAEFTVYSVSNNVKVRRDEDYARKGAAALDFEMAKNEVEGAQLIVNAQEDTTFNATVEKDLVSESGNRIFRSNVAVYAEHYVHVEVATTSFPLGYYPDALVPMRNYLAARDNRIAGGNNQGIYVTVTTEAGTPADVYRGQLKLVVGNTVTYVPITVTVWDFVLPEETHTKTAFTLWESQIFPEELDNSEEMLKTYYEFFLDRRVNSSYLPTYAADNLDEYVEIVKEYTARKDVTCFRLYYKTVYSSELSGWVLDLTHFENLLRALIENSTAQLNLMSKPYMYCSAVDEPQSASAFERVKYINDNIYRIIDELANEYSASGFFDDKPEVLESLLAFENVNTTYYREKYEDYVDTWCPTADRYNNEEYWQNSLEQRENGHGTWWYTCITPKYPQPTYHVDDYLISSRTLSWMQMKYGIEGNLYWATTIYKKYTQGGYVTRDVWSDPFSFTTNNGANGDGFLVYPGRKYGIYGPISTLRLESIREGMEDYEYLYMLQELLEAKGAEYAENVELNDYIGYLYSQLFSGTITNFTQDNIAFARREIASLITQLQQADSPLVVINGINAAANRATVTVYSRESSVEVNGTTVATGVNSGAGRKFTASVSLDGAQNYVTVRAGGKEYRRFVCAGISDLEGFDEESALSRLTASSFSAAAPDTIASLNREHRYIRSGTGSLKVHIVPAGNSSYFRSIALDVSSGGAYADFSDVRNICLSVYGDLPQNFTMYVKLTDRNGASYSVGNFYIKSGVWNEIRLGIMKVETMDFSAVRSVELSFPEIRSATGYTEEFDMYFDNLYLDGNV